MYFSMKYYTIFLLSLTVFFLFADQNLLAPNLSQIAEEFNFSDHEKDKKLGGYIAFGFFIIGGPASILIGHCTDLFNRVKLFGYVVIFGEISCILTAFSRTYVELLLCRIMTGVSVGGATPIVFSLLGDIYPEDERVYVSTLIGLALAAGIAFGQLVAGMVGPSYGWRLPFILIAVPAMICALLVYFTVEEPERGSQERVVKELEESSSEIINPIMLNRLEDESEKIRQKEEQKDHVMDGEEDISSVYLLNYHAISEKTYTPATSSSGSYTSSLTTMEKLKIIFSTPSIDLIFLQGLPGCLPWGVILIFMNDFLSNEGGLSVREATLLVTLFSIGGLFGQILGGVLGQYLYRTYGMKAQCYLMGTSTISSIIFLLILINGLRERKDSGEVVGGEGERNDDDDEVKEYLLFSCVAFIGGVIVSINGPNVRAILQVSNLILFN